MHYRLCNLGHAVRTLQCMHLYVCVCLCNSVLLYYCMFMCICVYDPKEDMRYVLYALYALYI
jgi:hypothetical protein